jgi:hypothetical protein
MLKRKPRALECARGHEANGERYLGAGALRVGIPAPAKPMHAAGMLVQSRYTISRLSFRRMLGQSTTSRTGCQEPTCVERRAPVMDLVDDASCMSPQWGGAVDAGRGAAQAHAHISQRRKLPCTCAFSAGMTDAMAPGRDRVNPCHCARRTRRNGSHYDQRNRGTGRRSGAGARRSYSRAWASGS